MDMLSAEQAIEAKLTADIPGVTVEAYPDSPEDYKFLGPNAALLVQYMGSQYGNPDLEAVRGKRVNQERLLEWRVVILYRNLKAHTLTASGIYTYIEAVRNSLSGYTVAGLTDAGLMFPVSDGFLSRTDNMLWEYEIVFRHTYPESEAFQ